MQKDKAIEFIQLVRKGISRNQIEVLIGNKIAEAGGILNEESAINLVLQDLGVAAPGEVSTNESFAERMRRLQEEPDKSGNFLKADKAKVGDLVKITAVMLEPAKTVDTARGPVDIPSRPQITGDYKPKGQLAYGEEIKFSLSKSNEKSLYAMWGKPLDLCIGKVMMVASIQTKTINGNQATWIEWTGLPE